MWFRVMPVVWNHQPQVLLPLAWSQFTSSVRAEETDKADSSTGEAAAIIPKSKRVFSRLGVDPVR